MALPNTVRSKSTDGILSFVLPNSGKKNEEMNTLIYKLSSRSVPKIIKKYTRNNENLIPNISREVGERKRKIEISYSHVSSSKEDSNDDEFLYENKERLLEKCLPGKNCAVRVIINTTDSARNIIIRKAIKKLRHNSAFVATFKKRSIGTVRIKKGRCGKFVITISFKRDYFSLSKDYIFRKTNADVIDQSVSLPEVMSRQKSCEGSASPAPKLVPTTEELNSFIFRQDSVLILHELNVNITSMDMDPLLSTEQFNETNSEFNSTETFPSNGTEEVVRPLQEIVHKQKKIPSKEVCRKIGCGLVATVHSHQEFSKEMVNKWILKLKENAAGFDIAFDHQKKQVSVKSRQTNTRAQRTKKRHIAVIFMPYKAEQFAPVPGKE